MCFYKFLSTLGNARREFLTCYFTGTFFSLVHLFTNWVNIGDFFMLLIPKDERYWPLMSPLPSYGYGREHKGPRYGSLIHGQDLKDVTITGRLCFFVPFFSYSYGKYQIDFSLYTFSTIQKHRKQKLLKLNLILISWKHLISSRTGIKWIN